MFDVTRNDAPHAHAIAMELRQHMDLIYGLDVQCLLSNGMDVYCVFWEQKCQ